MNNQILITMNKFKIITKLDTAYSKVCEAVTDENDVDTIQLIQPILNKIDEVQNQIRNTNNIK